MINEAKRKIVIYYNYRERKYGLSSRGNKMRTLRKRLILAPRDVILSKIGQRKEYALSNIRANIQGSFCIDIEANPEISDGDLIQWYGLISDPESILTSATAVFTNFKRDYLLLEVEEIKISEIIIEFEGIEVDDEIKEGVRALSNMLLSEYNPRVV